MTREDSIMHGMNDAQKADFEAQKQKLEKLKVDTENLVKRLRGEDVPSDLSLIHI